MIYNRTKNKASFFLLLSLLFSFSIQAQDHKVSGSSPIRKVVREFEEYLWRQREVQSIR